MVATPVQQIQQTPPTTVVTIQSQDTANLTEERAKTDQEDITMGPWNIPKHVARKRKYPTGKATKKGQDKSQPTATSS